MHKMLESTASPLLLFKWLIVHLLGYSLFRKKHPLMFLIITLAFLGRFFILLYQWKQKWILYNIVI